MSVRNFSTNRPATQKQTTLACRIEFYYFNIVLKYVNKHVRSYGLD